MPDLYALFESVLDGTRTVEREIRTSDHSLAVLCQHVLKEQQEQLERLLPKMQNRLDHLADYKKEVSIVYNDDELLDSYFSAWLRHLKWSSDPMASKAEQLLSVLKDMRSGLEEAAQALEDRFGYDAVKYVIPVYYFPTLR